MKAQKLKVLLIRESQNGQGYSPLSTRLAARGCDCRIAVSNREVDALIEEHHFDLVLGPIRLDGDSLYRLIDLLAGGNTTLFYSLGVEEGCSWLPALRRGENCFEAPAIPHKAFVAALEKSHRGNRLYNSNRLQASGQMPARQGSSVARFLASKFTD
jgi:hypothetical protein